MVQSLMNSFMERRLTDAPQTKIDKVGLYNATVSNRADLYTQRERESERERERLRERERERERDR